jgi:type IV secretion system protein VirB10
MRPIRTLLSCFAVAICTAQEGDYVYLRTANPIVADGRVIVPNGSYVQGVVSRAKQSGRVKGRAELQMSFTSMIFPNGYTVLIPASVEGVPGSQTMNTKGSEGTIQGDSSKGKDAATIARAASKRYTRAASHWPTGSLSASSAMSACSSSR